MKPLNREIVPVHSQRGAPMGRWECLDIQPVHKSVECFEVPINSGGYDQGGAYWGLGYGTRLYCLCQPDHESRDGLNRLQYFRVFVRARNRDAAIDKSGFAVDMFKRKPSGFVADSRFTCALEYYGDGEPGFVVRFCGDWVDVFPEYEQARKAAIDHPRNCDRG